MPVRAHVAFLALCLALAGFSPAAEPGASPAAAVASAGELSSTASAVAATESLIDVKTLVAKAQTLDLASDFQGARKILGDAYSKGVRDVDFLEALAVEELKTGAPAEGFKRLDEARAAAGDKPELVLWAAVAASASGLDAEAARLLSKGLSTAGDEEEALYDLAEKFLRAGALSVSSALYRKINDVYPTDSQFDVFSYLHLAAYYHMTNRNNLAAGIMDRARHPIEYSDVEIMTPQEVDYFRAYFRGMAAIRGGDLDAGVAILSDAAAAFPAGLAAQGEVVHALDAAGKKDRADGVYSMVMRDLLGKIAASPEDHAAYNSRAFFGETAGRNLEGALEAVNMALAISPLRPEYLDTKTAILLDLGRFDEALVNQDRMIALISAPRWAEPILFDLAAWRRLDILEKLGKPMPASLRQLPEPATAK